MFMLDGVQNKEADSRILADQLPAGTTRTEVRIASDSIRRARAGRKRGVPPAMRARSHGKGGRR